MVDFSDFMPTLCEAANIEIPQEILIDGISFLPQLLGKKGKSRKWIYSWYAPREFDELKEFTRNIEYKLYSTGEFYSIKDDFFEKTPLTFDSLNKKQKRAYKSLKKAMDLYEGAL
jgi:arylsulfatase A